MRRGSGLVQASLSIRRRNSRSTGKTERTFSVPRAVTTSAIMGARGRDRYEFLPRVIPIGPDMHMPGPFQFRQRIGHRPARDVKGAGQLGRRPLVRQARKMVENREMRQLHPLGQSL